MRHPILLLHVIFTPLSLYYFYEQCYTYTYLMELDEVKLTGRVSILECEVLFDRLDDIRFKNSLKPDVFVENSKSDDLLQQISDRTGEINGVCHIIICDI